VVLLAVVVVQTLLLVPALSGRGTVVHLFAPPMAIFDAQGEVWLWAPGARLAAPHGKNPGSRQRPGGASPGQRRPELLRREVLQVAIEIARELDPGQMELVAESRAEGSRMFGELSVWQELVRLTDDEDTVIGAPRDPPRTPTAGPDRP
jgi:hypothetical protein